MDICVEWKASDSPRKCWIRCSTKEGKRGDLEEHEKKSGEWYKKQKLDRKQICFNVNCVYIPVTDLTSGNRAIT